MEEKPEEEEKALGGGGSKCVPVNYEHTVRYQARMCTGAQQARSQMLGLTFWHTCSAKYTATIPVSKVPTHHHHACTSRHGAALDSSNDDNYVVNVVNALNDVASEHAPGAKPHQSWAWGCTWTRAPQIKHATSLTPSPSQDLIVLNNEGF